MFLYMLSMRFELHTSEKPWNFFCWFISSLIFLFFLHGLDIYRRRRLPPGPVGLPIIGNLLDIGPKLHVSLVKLSKKYGPLMTIRLGSITSVVASTPDAAREILQLNDEACSGRVVSDAVTGMQNHDSAILWISANDEWRTIRKALNTYLIHRNKLDTLQYLRQSVVEGMLEYLRESGQKNVAVDIGKLAFAVALNMMSNTILSQDVTNYESEDIGGGGRENIRRQAKAAHDWFAKLTGCYISERLKHRMSNLRRYGDMLDSLLDFSEDNEANFSLIHVRTLLVLNDKL
uniref:Cytochrome P450 n=1 Tax=Lactuca sativa TaxID=4236 RepID=A0A9R1XQZ8_LACSA|nr:hypothetical protein LSAT_V11C300147150 [Lactuca sativa]